MITIDNFEAYLLDKAEGNLNEKQLKELDEFLSQHPDLLIDNEEYDNSFKVTDYVDNTCDYQQEMIKKTIVFPAFKKVSLVAAVVSLLVVGYFFVKIYNNSNSVQTGNTIAKQGTETLKNQNNNTLHNTSKTDDNQTSIKQSSNFLKQRDRNLKQSSTKLKQRDRKLEQSSTETKENYTSSQPSSIDVKQEETPKELFAMETNLIDYKTTEDSKQVEIENNNLIEYKKQKNFGIILPKQSLSIDLLNINIAKK
ncbi:MAG: hypothetical protein IJ180_06960 [Bacteroidales bacterium]|nr:hypothetical protein [Bacteroidales bacterium]